MPHGKTACPENERYNYTQGSNLMKCCFVEPENITAQNQMENKEYKVKIDYYTGFDYIINFLPPYGNKGDKLCAISKASSYGAFEKESLYQSNYTNQFCSKETGNKCCYCRPGWGCKLECLNELNMSGSELFAPPFPAVGDLWELKDTKVVLSGTKPATVVNLTAEGDIKEGWKISAKLGENANLILDQVYAIPFNLYSDFKLKAPADRGQYTLGLRLDYNVTVGLGGLERPDGNVDGSTQTTTTITVQAQYSFSSVDCLNEGEKRQFYDESAYPGTKGRGICRSGTQVCKKVTDKDLRWRYETTGVMPVYPSAEACDGIDNDCNGIIDDVKTFDAIINEIIRGGGRKSPQQVSQCGCFMGAPATAEKCNGIDDDCNGAIDEASTKVWANTCDTAVLQCLSQGNPYTWCRNLYNSSQCSIVQKTIAVSGNVSVNTCTANVKKCMENMHVRYSGQSDSYATAAFTYGECEGIYNNYSCLFETRNFVFLEDTCRCTDNAAKPGETQETCNGIDDNCDGMIDDVSSASLGTCGCAMLTNATLIHMMKAGGDASCDGIDSDCDGAIDEDAKSCACTARTSRETFEIKSNVVEKCDGIDNDCNGLADENFPQLGKACGYGLCLGGTYVCGVHGDEAVCNTTVSPDETFSGKALKLSYTETCDLKDNDCDYSIDESCACTPENAVKLCGYQSGIYYRSREQLDQVCGRVVDELKKLITWAEAPENVKFRKLITVKNLDSVSLSSYPVNITVNSFQLATEGKLRQDGGDLRIVPSGEETHLAWSNSTPFMRSQTGVWFRTDLKPNEDKKFYMYYGSPVATYATPGMSAIVGLSYDRNVFLLCHFDGTSQCEGNMFPKYEEGIRFVKDRMDVEGEAIPVEGALIDGIDKLTYPTSENFNKNRGTIMMWFKPSDLTDEHYLFFSDDLGGKPQFSLRFSSNGTFFDVWDKAGKNQTVNAGVVNLDWHHVAATWDNLKGISLYVDGALKASKSVAWEANDIGMDVYIGNDGAEKSAYALIEELGVYSQALDRPAILEKMRYYRPLVTVGPEETLNETVAQENQSIYEKCSAMLENVSSSDSSMKATVLSLCDSVRICDKSGFAVNAISECTFGMQSCVAGEWKNCTAVMPRTEVCNQKDDDCNGIIDDVAVPETCACSNGGKPGVETCNGVDDNCNERVDDVRGMDSVNSTHCGCFGQIVNITQRRSEPETICNGVDDNCNGAIDEGLSNCACAGTLFSPSANTWATAISVEKCNGIDEDCNGMADDPWQQGGSAARKFEYLGAPCSPVNSRCVGGMFVCSKNATSIVCSTSSNEGVQGQDLRTNETCNGIDDDCNGRIDDVWGDISYKFCGCYNGAPRSEEVCNGKDDDCDGYVDSGLSNCGCSFSIEANVNNINELAVLINTQKTSGESCNNIDDDCNGAIDDGLEGECFCSGGFSGSPALKPEFCNGLDDDCDGLIDDVTVPETCGCYNGTHTAGEVQEICDGIDDDCNGLVDEFWPSLGGSCGLGACTGGVYECAGENGTICSTGPGGSADLSQDEECGDAIDNDCNGVSDENCVCDVVGEQRSCSVDEGACRKGIQTCLESGWSGCIGGVLPKPETCNGIDDDCDGTIDNVPSGGCGCYGGGQKTDEICNGIDDDCDGVVDNVGDKTSVAATKCGCYNYAYAKGAKAEVCNGIDDDCDGIIDNVKGGDSVASTLCACYNDAPPGVESCNGIDEDCDGAMDEDWPTLGQACGQGICTGAFVCSEDGKTVVCNGGLPATEMCDEKDNDCDGTIDEGCLGGAETGSCENGIRDGYEEGVDCGGSCPVSCSMAAMPMSNTWMIVFGVLLAVIVAVGVIMIFLKPKSPV